MTPKGSRPVLRGLVGSNAHPATQLIDFVAVLFGYAISGERTLEGFYEQIDPWADTFMALFGRDRLPARATLSRFLTALDQAAVESLRSLFLKDLLARPRCGWHARGSPPTGLAPDPRSACATAAIASAVCSWVHWAQARGSRENSHHGLASPYSSVARHVWKSWEWGIPKRAALGSGGDPKLPQSVPPS